MRALRSKNQRHKVRNFVLSPGITDYRRRVQYQTYDVTDLVKNGENVIEVELADGWYRGSCGAWGRKASTARRQNYWLSLS